MYQSLPSPAQHVDGSPHSTWQEFCGLCGAGFEPCPPPERLISACCFAHCATRTAKIFWASIFWGRQDRRRNMDAVTNMDFEISKVYQLLYMHNSRSVPICCLHSSSKGGRRDLREFSDQPIHLRKLTNAETFARNNIRFKGCALEISEDPYEHMRASRQTLKPIGSYS